MTFTTSEQIVKTADEGGKARALVVTALGSEVRGALAHLDPIGSARDKNGNIYECGEFRGDVSWLVVVAQCGPGNDQAQEITRSAHHEFDEFDLVINIGCAGSRKDDVPIGSVVASNRVYEVHTGKTDSSDFFARPHVYPTPTSLVQLAMKVERDELWTDRIKASPRGLPPGDAEYPDPFPPYAFVAPIASTRVVMNDPGSSLERQIASHYNDAQCVEMEGYGVSCAAFTTRTPAIVVRGISDKTENKRADTDAYLQPIAVSHACAFAFELISLMVPDRLFRSGKAAGPRSLVEDHPDPAPAERPEDGGQLSENTRVRISLVLAGNIEDYPTERVQSIANTLREVTEDPSIEVVSVESGSVVLTVSAATTSLEALRSSQVAHALRAIDVEVIGTYQSEALEADMALRDELQRASYDLLKWPRFLPNGEHLDRPEKEQIVQQILSRDRSATVILGTPGAGKSSLLADIAETAIAIGWPVLGIKADILEATLSDEDGLRRQLDTSELPSAMLKRLARAGTVLLVVDQLDALASLVDLKTERLNVLLNMIRRLGDQRNVHIVASARTFEFNHDVRLRSIEAQCIELEPPPWREVEKLLTTQGFKPEGWPPDAKELLRTPQALATFLRLEHHGGEEPSQTYQAMLERLWAERVLASDNGDVLSRLAIDIAEQMANEETLWLARARYDDSASEVHDLERLGILIGSPSGSAVAFSHQTLFDHVLARSFARDHGSLSSFVAQRQASLFVRPKLWAALRYLREVEEQAYGRELRGIWKLDLRPHLTSLLVDFMGQQSSPKDTEVQLIIPLLRGGEHRARAFRAIRGSAGWFEATSGSAIPTAMAENQESAWLAAGVLQAAWPFARDRTTELLREYWAGIPNFDLHLWNVLAASDEWTHSLVELAAPLLCRSQITADDVEYIVSRVATTQPELALKLLRIRFDHDLDEAVSKSPQKLERPGPNATIDELVEWETERPGKHLEELIKGERTWDVLPTLAESAPVAFLDALWAWFERALAALAKLGSRGESSDSFPAVSWSLDFQFSQEPGGHGLPPPPVLDAFCRAAEGAAANPTELRNWASKAISVELAPAQRLLAHAFAMNGEVYAKDSFNFLMGDSRRFCLGGTGDDSSTTKALVRAASPHWTQSMTEQFCERIQSYNPAPPSNSDPQLRLNWFRHNRRLRLGLLEALPEERRPTEVKKQVREEGRVFGHKRTSVSSSGGMFIGSPMESDAMRKASDEDILTAFQKIPDRTEWHHPRGELRGGNVQLARAFAEFAKEQPERAISIISRMTPEIGSRASGYALAAMAESTDPDFVLSAFLDTASREFEGDEFRESAARAIEQLVNRDVTPGEDVVQFLCSWLGTNVSKDESRPVADEDDVAERRRDSEDSVRTILWDSMRFTVLPHGNYPILESLTRVLLQRGETDRAAAMWKQHLDRPERQEVWAALLPQLHYLREDDSDPREDLLQRLFLRYPALPETSQGAWILGHAHWWAPDVVRGVLQGWRDHDDPWLQQLLGELSALVGLIQPDLDWGVELLEESQAPTAPLQRKIGTAFSAVNLWEQPQCRRTATEVLVALIPQAEPRLWSAILDLFRLVDSLGDDIESERLLITVADHIRTAGRQPHSFLVGHLQSILPDRVELVGRITEGIIANLSEEVGDIRTGAAADAPELVDIALTLHRLGGPTRELGVHLFEELLRLDAYSARTTLDEIDSRFRANAAPPRRPRLRRRTRRKKSTNEH